MNKVRIFLRTTLFTIGGEPHVPQGIFVIDGQLEDQTGGGILVVAETYMDDTLKRLDGEPRKLFLPSAKVDHLVFLEK